MIANGQMLLGLFTQFNPEDALTQYA